jgi:hypothetical protein
MFTTLRTGALALALSSAALTAQAASFTTLEVTVENLASTGGFSFTPLYFAFQDGNFDAFSAGQAASAGLELLAEEGNPSGLAAERLAVSPGSQGGTIAAPGNGVPPVDPGESSSVTVDVDGAQNRYFTFLSMILPSNDAFFGSADPLGILLFDAAGGFLGDRVINVTGAQIYDAGTEVNDPGNGPAFIAGQTITDGADEGGVVKLAQDLSGFAGLSTPLGPVDGNAIDFASDRNSFAVARISIREVAPAPVPLPAGAVLLLGGLGALGGLRARRKAR